jgi:hypothetical protein
VNRRHFAMALATMGFWALLAPSARAAGDAAAVRGTWAGPWYLGMTSGIARLVLSGEGALEGSLQMTNNERFGEETVRLTEAAFDGATLRFKVAGADGKALVAELPVSGDGARMKGFGKYGGYNVRFELSRQK